MSLVLGLDASTSCVGICIYDSDLKKHVLLDHVSFDDDQNVWQRADKVRDRLRAIDVKIDIVGVEEIVKMFTPGASTADTITKLARFNGLVSYISRDIFSIDPIHISCGDARRACGLKMTSKKRDPLKRNHKHQSFDTMMELDLKLHVFPKKRATKKKPNPDYVDWAYDEVDAYIVAKAIAKKICLC